MKGGNTFDVIVIGSGSAGFEAAETIHARGARVLIIESKKWGGECPNNACVPTKALLKSAKKYHDALFHLKEYGIHPSDVTFSFKEVMQRKTDVVDLITRHGQKIPKIAKDIGIETEKGRAIFVDKNTIKVGKKEYKAKAFVIATGAVDYMPPIDGLDKAGYINYEDVINLKSLPNRMAIIGGGPVACEFATFFSAFGTKVHILQLGETILNREDAEIAGIAADELVKRGVEIHVNTKTLSVRRSGKKKRVVFQVGDDARQTINVDAVLLAAGKRANVMELNLDAAKVKVDDRGRLNVTEDLQTSAKHIFAAGDVSGGMMFTHTAHYEGRIAGGNVMNFLEKKNTRAERDLRVVPRVTFVNPEVASVGITAAKAEKAKKKILIGRFPIGVLGRAVTEGERVGMVKLVVDKKTRKILGGHIAGPRAGEMIHEIALAMQAGIKVDVLRDMIHAYPTYSEGVAGAASVLK